MPDASHLLIFILAGWLLNLTPGPDVLYIVTNSLRGGWKAGMVAGVGITMGCFVHVFAAALGVGALLATSAMAFSILKWMGAAYLLYVGVRILLAGKPGKTQDLAALAHALPPTNYWKIFIRGFWTNVLNPKVVLFFLAFLPQFIDPQVENHTVVFLLLGILFNINSIPVNLGWALVAAWMAKRDTIQRGMHWLDKAAGCMFIVFSVRLALTEQPHS